MLVQCWPAIYDAAQTLKQHWFNGLSFLVRLQHSTIIGAQWWGWRQLGQCKSFAAPGPAWRAPAASERPGSHPDIVYPCFLYRSARCSFRSDSISYYCIWPATGLDIWIVRHLGRPQVQQVQPSKHKPFALHLYNVGPTSSTLGQRCINVMHMLCVCWQDGGDSTVVVMGDRVHWIEVGPTSLDLCIAFVQFDIYSDNLAFIMRLHLDTLRRMNTRSLLWMDQYIGAEI